ncbi:MAG: RagB/SusD family nutrient uptake outer membrane protein [Prolixibacteraceae bacterium]
MRSIKIFSLLMVSLLVITACKFLEPENDNHSTIERVYDDPSYAEGLLIRAFTYITTNDYRWDEVATDDAVTNDKLNSFMRMAKGEWSALYDPQNLWDNSNKAILYINEFLSIVDQVNWKWTSPEQNTLFIKRLKGESYALRGMFKYYLLRNHGGVGSNGTLLGTPIYNEFLATPDAFSKPRATFAECVTSANADFAEALKYLPMDYGNVATLAGLPAGFTDVKDINSYNTVMGDFSRQRVSGRIVNALKARLALLAASPAFNATNDLTLWQNAANIAGEVLNGINGISGLDSKGHIFYLAAQVTEANLSSGDLKDLGEILWRRPVYTDQVREVANFPPSLYGNGRVNPSQNLVDAFPMANGYPIGDVNSKYNPAAPYTGRDPRLALYVVYNGSSMKSTVITTGVGGGSNALDATTTSTRTGYYLRKLLREEVNANPAASSTQQHFQTHIRYTEMFLNYAEAANEAWGPDGKGTFTFSAKDVIAAIRKRAGITQPDSYLTSITDKVQMRALIHNERRLELCFEGFRFWDVRRWKDDLTVPAKGVSINGTTYTYFTVENRAYNNTFMMYGPIPDKEIIKFNFVQNNGWK